MIVVGSISFCLDFLSASLKYNMLIIKIINENIMDKRVLEIAPLPSQAVNLFQFFMLQ